MTLNQLFDEITLAIGVILMLTAVAAFRRTRKFIAACRTTPGRITGYRSEESDEGPVFHFAVIRFRDASGVEREMPGPHGLQEPPIVGAEVSITYDPAYPANAWISGSTAPWVIPWLILIAGIGAVAASFVIRAES